jgi:hypothetical protein
LLFPYDLSFVSATAFTFRTTAFCLFYHGRWLFQGGGLGLVAVLWCIFHDFWRVNREVAGSNLLELMSVTEVNLDDAAIRVERHCTRPQEGADHHDTECLGLQLFGLLTLTGWQRLFLERVLGAIAHETHCPWRLLDLVRNSHLPIETDRLESLFVGVRLLEGRVGCLLVKLFFGIGGCLGILVLGQAVNQDVGISVDPHFRVSHRHRCRLLNFFLALWRLLGQHFTWVLRIFHPKCFWEQRGAVHDSGDLGAQVVLLLAEEERVGVDGAVQVAGEHDLDLA